MSKQNKFAGNFGKVASGGSATTGSNVYKPVEKVAAPRSGSSKSDNIIKMPVSLSGQNAAVVPDGSSSHNSINAFTRGIKSRGPYGGPTFASLNNSKQNMQKSNTSSISHFSTPSGGAQGSGGRKSGGGSNKNGSGYQDLA